MSGVITREILFEVDSGHQQLAFFSRARKR